MRTHPDNIVEKSYSILNKTRKVPREDWRIIKRCRALTTNKGRKEENERQEDNNKATKTKGDKNEL